MRSSSVLKFHAATTAFESDSTTLETSSAILALISAGEGGSSPLRYSHLSPTLWM